MKAGWIVALAMASPALAQSIELQRQVAQKDAVTLADAVMLFYGLVNDPDPALTEEKAFADLIKKEILPEDWKKDAKEAASLGQVSYMICKMLGIEGGAVMRVFGPSRRYCYKECARLKIVKPAGPHARVPGRDMIAIVGRVEDLAAQKPK